MVIIKNDDGSYTIKRTLGKLRKEYNIGKSLSGRSVYIQSKSLATKDVVYLPKRDLQEFVDILSGMIDK